MNITSQHIKEIAAEAMRSQDHPAIKITEPGTKYHVFMALLAKAMLANRIIELGTYVGESSKQIGLSCPDAEVWTIDINPDAKRQIDKIAPIVPNVKAFTGHSEYFRHSGRYDNKPIDLLFIDSNHDYAHTMGNFNSWKDMVRTGGLIAFDDWTLDQEMERVRQVLMRHGTKEAFDYEMVEVNEVHATGFAVMIKR